MTSTELDADGDEPMGVELETDHDVGSGEESDASSDDQDDEAQRKSLLDQGALAAVQKEVRGGHLRSRDNIKRFNKILSKVSDEAPSKSRIHAEIARQLRKVNKNLDKDQEFPIDEFIGYFDSISDAWDSFADRDSDDNLQDNLAIKLVDFDQYFCRKYGLPFKLFISGSTLRDCVKLQMALHQREAMHAEPLLRVLNGPTLAQIEQIGYMVSLVSDLLSGEPLDKDKTVDEIHRQGKEIRRLCNEHKLPKEHIDNTLNALAPLLKGSPSNGETFDLMVKNFLPAIDWFGPLPEKWGLVESLASVRKAADKSDAKGKSRATITDRPSSSEPLTSTSTAVNISPRAKLVDEPGPAKTVARAAKLPTNTRERSKTKTAVGGIRKVKQVLIDDEWDDSVVLARDDSNTGKTHKGYVDFVRQLPGPLSGYRLIINVGTLERKHYKIFSGANFGKQFCEDLDSKKKNKLSVKLEGLKEKHIQDVHHTCQVATNHDVYFRRPATYFLVEWQKEVSTKQDWLTLSQLSSIVGRKRVLSTYLPQAVAKWKRNETYLKKCRNLGLHPDTRATLSCKDRTKTPWLFPEPEEDECILGKGTLVRQNRHVSRRGRRARAYDSDDEETDGDEDYALLSETSEEANSEDEEFIDDASSTESLNLASATAAAPASDAENSDSGEDTEAQRQTARKRKGKGKSKAKSKGKGKARAE